MSDSTLEIHVKYFSLVENVTKKKRETFKFKEGVTLKDLIDTLLAIYGRPLKQIFIGYKSKLDNEVFILRNNRDIYLSNGLKTTLKDQDSIVIGIGQPISGG